MAEGAEIYQGIVEDEAAPDKPFSPVKDERIEEGRTLTVEEYDALKEKGIKWGKRSAELALTPGGRMDGGALKKKARLRMKPTLPGT
jgi:hypothetical protein